VKHIDGGTGGTQLFKSSRGGFTAVTAAILLYLTCVPLLLLVYQTFFTPEFAGHPARFTFDNYLKVFANLPSFRVMSNTIVFALGSSVVALLIGGALAWVTERTRTPGRRLIYFINMVPLVLPGILVAMAWVILLSPKVGIVNLFFSYLLNLKKPLFNVYSMGGMVWIQGIHWAPFAFITLSGAFRSMNPDLEEAATTAGAGVWSTLRLVTLPINLPALFSLSLILFIRGIESFVIPAVIGIPAGIDVVTSKIYEAVAKSYPRDFGLASTYSVGLMVITVIGLFFYYRATHESSEFATITGKGYRARLIDVGRWRYLTAGLYLFYFIAAVGLPLAMLLWVSLTPYTMPISLSNLGKMTLANYVEVFKYPGGTSAVMNTIVLSALASLVIVVLGITVSFIVVKLKVRGARILDALGTFPLAFPGTVVGVALATVYLRLPFGIYGTIWILLIAYITRFLPYGVRAANSALLQIHVELEEAGLVSGASLNQTLARVTFPLVMSGMVGMFIYIMTLVIREFPTAILLYGPGSRVIAVQLFEMWEGGFFNQTAAMGVLLIAILSVLALLMRRFQTKEA